MAKGTGFRNRFPHLGIFFVIALALAIPLTVWSLNNVSTQLQQRASGTYDLKSSFPNTNMFSNYYLEGFNYHSGTPARSVLWFEQQDQWTFKMYNSGPEDVNKRCHYDVLSWWDDGFLRYSKTHDECPGHVSNEIVYDAPIIFLPRTWDGSTLWSYTGSSSATYYENGVVQCTGVINYTGKILGIEQIAPNEQGIHWNTTQVTTWTSGNLPGKCGAGFTTKWLEDYWLTGILPVGNGSTAPALKRSKGGNTEITNDNWDVWFDTWKLLPWATLTPTAFLTPTPTQKPIDTIFPKVTIISPLNGTIVQRNSTTVLKAVASDNVAVSKVEFYYKASNAFKSILICTIISSPYNCNWTVPNTRSNYTIAAKAYDTSNNTALSSISLIAR